MQYIFMALFALGIVGLDQFTKLLVVQNFALYEQKQAIDGLFYLTYVRNTGAAFSVLQGMRWLFLVIFLLFALAIVWEFTKNCLGLTTFERWCVVAIFGGGLGNMIDRVRLGYVVDMIALDFMEFPVFNVADCFITCGCILLMVHLVFANRRFWRDEKK